jgi:hypothetical protein
MPGDAPRGPASSAGPLWFNRLVPAERRHGRATRPARRWSVGWFAIWLGKLTRFWDGLAVQRTKGTNMSVWEYKVISSGKGGFATPALLEKFLGDLGRDEWEIIHYQTSPDNPLAFSGLARRPTQRDWTLEGAASAAAKAEADKVRAEFEAKFKEVASRGPAGAEEAAPASFLEEKVAPEDGLRSLVDTSRDADADADDEESKGDEWDKLTAQEEDELPTFFEAMRPHMRRNQRGPGMSVGVDYLARKWDQSEEDIKGALIECGFVIPESEDDKPVYLEYDGDLYWLNENRRGELWINTKEKPRRVFRAVKAERVTVEEPVSDKSDRGQRKSEPVEAAAKPEGGAPSAEAPVAEGSAPAAKSDAPSAPLPEGAGLLEKIRPLMRRNRRGPGGSGSGSFLSRALKCSEADLKAAFAGLGLTIPATPNDAPVYVEIEGQLWWLNLDSRGGLWINGRDKEPGETVASANAAPAEAPAPAATEAAPAASGEQPPATAAAATEAKPAGDTVFAVVRPSLKPAKTGVSAKVEAISEERGTAMDELVNHLVAAGLKLPEKPREKAVYVEAGGELYWLARNSKGELWLNAKPAQGGDAKAEGESDEKGGERKGGRSRGRRKSG